MEEKTIYTPKEAAKLLGISPSTIYRIEKRGLISSVKISARKRYFYLERGKYLNCKHK